MGSLICLIVHLPSASFSPHPLASPPHPSSSHALHEHRHLAIGECDHIFADASLRATSHPTSLLSFPSTDSASSPSSTTSDHQPVRRPSARKQRAPRKVTTQKATSSKPSTSKVPRPPNPFFIYRSAVLPDLAAVEPDNRIKSKIIGQLWKKMPPDEKELWNKKGELAKAQHKEKYPDYRYQPSKRKEEQKRRTSKRTGPKEDRRRDTIVDLLIQGFKGEALDEALKVQETAELEATATDFKPVADVSSAYPPTEQVLEHELQAPSVATVPLPNVFDFAYGPASSGALQGSNNALDFAFSMPSDFDFRVEDPFLSSMNSTYPAPQYSSQLGTIPSAGYAAQLRALDFLPQLSSLGHVSLPTPTQPSWPCDSGFAPPDSADFGQLELFDQMGGEAGPWSHALVPESQTQSAADLAYLYG
ncbi:Silenced mating-type M-specific polypeptide Mc [Grifola frondosa]|uniref:Silenced mating-type M-specific polypeptide Mc n=1 Tax=Grifola frondosa TaxID=5627 RepID=A0A1C7MXP5_GRIFR|nr:Silenced mating-type M-specific polypeptide Mc [Grifola frondosa]